MDRAQRERADYPRQGARYDAVATRRRAPGVVVTYRLAALRNSAAVSLDPGGEGLHVLAQEIARAIVAQLAFVIEQRVGMADVSFWLLQARHIEEHQRLAQMVIRTEGADRA